jgi:hypothetical protein
MHVCLPYSEARRRRRRRRRRRKNKEVGTVGCIHPHTHTHTRNTQPTQPVDPTLHTPHLRVDPPREQDRERVGNAGARPGAVVPRAVGARNELRACDTQH